MQEDPAQLGGAEREGQLSPNEPKIAGVLGVQRPTARRPDRQVAERDVARPADAQGATLL